MASIWPRGTGCKGRIGGLTHGSKTCPVLGNTQASYNQGRRLPSSKGKNDDKLLGIKLEAVISKMNRCAQKYIMQGRKGATLLLHDLHGKVLTVGDFKYLLNSELGKTD